MIQSKPACDSGLHLRGAARVNGAPFAELVSEIGNLLHLVIGESLVLAVGAVRQLDQVNAVFYLGADLGEHVRQPVRSLADRAVRVAHRGRVVVDKPVGGGDVSARGEHLWPGHQAGTDAVAQRNPDVVTAPRLRDRGHARPEHPARVRGGNEGPGLDPRVKVDLLLGLALAIGHVTVGVDQARHYRLAGGVKICYFLTARDLLAERCGVAADPGDLAVVNEHRGAIAGARLRVRRRCCRFSAGARNSWCRPPMDQDSVVIPLSGCRALALS